MSQFPASPFYRKSRTTLNPNTEAIQLRAATSPPVVYLYGEDLETSGPGGSPNWILDCGSVAEAVEFDISAAWDDSIVGDHVDTSAPRAVFGIYDGDADAFSYQGNTLQGDFETFPVTLLPTSVQVGGVGYVFRIGALAADDGVEKTGTLTLYANFKMDGEDPVFYNPVGTLSMSKTYNP